MGPRPFGAFPDGMLRDLRDSTLTLDGAEDERASGSRYRTGKGDDEVNPPWLREDGEGGDDDGGERMAAAELFVVDGDEDDVDDAALFEAEGDVAVSRCGAHLARAAPRTSRRRGLKSTSDIPTSMHFNRYSCSMS